MIELSDEAKQHCILCGLKFVSILTILKGLSDFFRSRAFNYCCHGCGRPTTGDSLGYLCTDCQSRCTVHRPDDFSHWIESDGITSFGIYEGIMAQLLIRYKKGLDTSGSRVICRRIAPLFDVLIRDLRNAGPSHARQDNVIVTWPPGSRRPAIRRGYDHMKSICRTLCRNNRQPGLRTMRLFRRNSQLQQKKLTKAQRLEHARTLFSLRPGATASLNIQAIYLVIDDVSTSGATLANCASLLRAAGCKRVYKICILRD